LKFKWRLCYLAYPPACHPRGARLGPSPLVLGVFQVELTSNY
jgi:hypothetical protein